MWYFNSELELGDIRLVPTDKVEKELFPEYKARGLGVLPEIGLTYKQVALSVAYGLPFNKLTSEKGSEPDAYDSTGSIRVHSLQVNAGYRFCLF